jgi:hypothetical protein
MSYEYSEDGLIEPATQDVLEELDFFFLNQIQSSELQVSIAFVSPAKQNFNSSMAL